MAMTTYATMRWKVANPINANFAKLSELLGKCRILKRAPFVSCQKKNLPREDKDSILKGVQQDHRLVAARAIDQAVAASNEWSVAHTDFLTPPAQKDVMMVLSRLSDIQTVVSGGYSEAERCRVSMGHPEAMELSSSTTSGYPGAVAAVKVVGRFDLEPASHGDFLGSVLGTGIAREKVGDIIVQTGAGAQILLVPELVEFVMGTMTSVRKVSVQVEPISLSEIKVAPTKVEVVKSVESSLRVDAITSAGFRMSRTKLSEIIDSGLLRVNWKEVSKGSITLKIGDVVSVRGKGRLEVGSISVTKKGRFAVEIIKYS